MIVALEMITLAVIVIRRKDAAAQDVYHIPSDDISYRRDTSFAQHIMPTTHNRVVKRHLELL